MAAPSLCLVKNGKALQLSGFSSPLNRNSKGNFNSVSCNCPIQNVRWLCSSSYLVLRYLFRNHWKHLSSYTEMESGTGERACSWAGQSHGERGWGDGSRESILEASSSEEIRSRARTSPLQLLLHKQMLRLFLNPALPPPEHWMSDFDPWVYSCMFFSFPFSLLSCTIAQCKVMTPCIAIFLQHVMPCQCCIGCRYPRAECKFPVMHVLLHSCKLLFNLFLNYYFLWSYSNFKECLPAGV